MKQYISFGPSSGICNRIKRLFSALRFDVDMYETLEFYWSHGDLTNRNFYELFDFDLFSFNEITCYEKVVLEDALDVAAKYVWRLKIKDGEVPKGFTKSYPKDVSSEEYIDFEYERIPKKIRKEYMKYFQALKPAEEVKKRINTLTLPENCVSVHVRQDRFWNEYNRGDADSIDVFLDTMRAYPENTFFFLAAADKRASQKINAEFPGRIIELSNKDYEDSIDAVAELYLLGKTKELIATYGSTFSEVAWWLGECKQKVKVVGNANDWGVKCPVCGRKSTEITSYSKDRCKQLHSEAGRTISLEMELMDYTINKCNGCDLMFANPMKGEIHGQLIEERDMDWQWREVEIYIRNKNVQSILEVANEKKTYGEVIKETGIKYETINVSQLYTKQDITYDLMIAWDVLERVEEPVQVVKSMMNLLNSKGVCLLSFQYREGEQHKYFDKVSQMPPYYFTRWNYSAIKALADEVNADFEWISPRSQSLIAKVKDNLCDEFGTREEQNIVTGFLILIKAIRHLRRSKNIICRILNDKKICVASHIGGKTKWSRPAQQALLVLKKRNEDDLCN